MEKNKIKNFNGDSIFSHEAEGNTLKATLQKAVNVGANLYGANLEGANLKGTDLE